MQSCSISEVITSPWGIHRCHAQPLYDCKMQLRPSQGSPTVMHSKLHTINLHFNTHNETTEVSLILRSRPNKKIIFDKTSLQQVKYKSGYKKKKSDVNCKIYLCLTTQNWKDEHGSNYGGICSCMFCLRQQKIDRLSVSKGFQQSVKWQQRTDCICLQPKFKLHNWFCSELLYHGTCFLLPDSQSSTTPTLPQGQGRIKTNLDSCLDTV